MRTQEPKSTKSYQSLPLPYTVVKLLAGRLAKNKAEGWKNPFNVVFLTEFGEPVDERGNVKDHFNPLLEKVKLPKRVRLYDLRHTHATLLLLASVHPKIVSERLGHASIQITVDTYSHVLPNMQQETVDMLEALLFQDTAKIVHIQN